MFLLQQLIKESGLKKLVQKRRLNFVMDIKILSSGSHGNCYQLDDGKTRILLEAGIPIAKIKKGLDYYLAGVSACVVSHSHLDHAKAVKDVMKAGIPCFCSGGTANALKLSGHRLNVIESKKQFQVKSWTIVPFNVEHDAPDPLGFMLASGNDRVFFSGDTAYIKPKFKDLSHILIECNYCTDILEANYKTGTILKSRRDRLLFSHMSLENVLEFLKANDLSKVRQIILCHLSAANSNAARMKQEVMALTGKPVTVA